MNLRKCICLVAVIVAVLALVALALCWYYNFYRPWPVEQPKQALSAPKGTPTRPQGMKALTVNAGAAQPFTQADVAAYFQTHNLPRNLGSSAAFQVESLDFITAKQARERLAGAETGLPDEAKAGFATLRGTFIFTGPPATGKTVRFDRAYALFDAGNGNLLMIGTLENARPR